MAWIEVHQGIFFHRKTLLLATLTGRTPNDTVATLIRFWHWAMSHAETGETMHIPHEVLEHAACAEAGWIAHCYTAGWIDPDGRIHEWDKYTGKLIKRRKDNAERMSIARDRERAAHVQNTGTPHVRMLQDRTGQHTTGQDPDGGARVPAEDEPAAAAFHRFLLATLDDFEDAIPGITKRREDRDLLIRLRTEFQTVALHHELRKMRLHFSDGPPRGQTWARVFTSWITNARSVRYIDDTDDKPRIDQIEATHLLELYPPPPEDLAYLDEVQPAIRAQHQTHTDEEQAAS